jgi:Ser/Thr protein kinase RdoA (MazF antagonist)
MAVPAELWEGARAVLGRYFVEEPRLEPIGPQLINTTFRVATREGRRYVLQRLHSVFAPAINEDIDRVSKHLAAKGLATPLLIPTLDGRSWVELNGACWRLTSYVEGYTVSALANPAQARNVGALLGAFHAALADYPHAFRNARLGVHDLDRHLRVLRDSLTACREHPRHGAIAPLAQAILSAAAALEPVTPLPDRVVHGDPKISNFVFRHGTLEALCLIDLDTLARMPLPFELGDAFRSWCNPAGEDVRDPNWSLQLFEAALVGYAETTRGILAKEERLALVPATIRICVELAARFCADALREDYFGWSPEKFASHSEHSEVRAAGQLALARSVQSQRDAATAVIAKLFA